MIEIPIEHRFAEILEHHLNVRLQKHVGSSLNQSTLGKIYEEIQECVDKIFYNSKMNLSDESRKWIACKYYEALKFSDSVIITGDSETWKYSVTHKFVKPDVKRIPDSDLRFMAGLFSEMTFSDEITLEMKNRKML
jgi:hypothetical protein